MTVNHNARIEELINFFDTNDFYGVPVINDEQHLVGVVLRKDIREEEMEMANQTLLQTQGIVGGEELRTMPFLLRSRRQTVVVKCQYTT
ncbi:MAG: CBS domain-containing protein [Bacteroidetes bacterium]|nr:CBS domain-containing protein [Bacteroidota bacterium]MDA1121260.1 CBS domain-containing protein [Bacteroidota bacterium]